jgi:hypothetical protein
VIIAENFSRNPFPARKTVFPPHDFNIHFNDWITRIVHIGRNFMIFLVNRRILVYSVGIRTIRVAANSWVRIAEKRTTPRPMRKASSSGNFPKSSMWLWGACANVQFLRLSFCVCPSFFACPGVSVGFKPCMYVCAYSILCEVMRSRPPVYCPLLGFVC